MERYVATRTVSASPDQVFAVLTDPDRHQYTEPGTWVRGAVDPTPIDHVGQMFSVNMYLDQAGGDYVMENKVTDFVPDRTIGWLPGTTQDGRWQQGGWWWRYDLAPAAHGTDVTLTYDWTDTPQAFRDQIGGMPPFPSEFLDESLTSLDRHLQG